MGYGISGGKVVVRMGEEGAAYPAGYTTVGAVLKGRKCVQP